MNILMLLFKDIHYDARVQREALALAEAGFQVIIACLEEYVTPPPDLHPQIRIYRLPILTKRIRRSVVEGKKENSINRFVFKIVRNPAIKLLKDIMANREFYLKIKTFIQAQDIHLSVVHCHDLNTLPVGYFLAKQFGTKLVYDSHELFNEMVGKNEVERNIGYIIERRLIKSIDHLIVVNPYVKKEFLKRYGDMPCTIVQNTPILPDLTELKKEEENYWRVKYELSDNEVILLYQGGMTPERGIEECIHSLKLLPTQYKLVLLGEGRIKEKLKELVEKLDLSDRVFFHDQVPPDEILWYTKQADIGLVMYKNTCENNYYSTPNKIFEYMMAGIPTVASDHPGKSYLIEKEQTGVCVAETPQSIKEGIMKVNHDYLFYRNNCIEKRGSFCWQVEKKGIAELYKKLERC